MDILPDILVVLYAICVVITFVWLQDPDFQDGKFNLEVVIVRLVKAMLWPLILLGLAYAARGNLGDHHG